MGASLNTTFPQDHNTDSLRLVSEDKLHQFICMQSDRCAASTDKIKSYISELQQKQLPIETVISNVVMFIVIISAENIDYKLMKIIISFAEDKDNWKQMTEPRDELFYGMKTSKYLSKHRKRVFVLNDDILECYSNILNALFRIKPTEHFNLKQWTLTPSDYYLNNGHKIPIQLSNSIAKILMVNNNKERQLYFDDKNHTFACCVVLLSKKVRILQHSIDNIHQIPHNQLRNL